MTETNVLAREFAQSLQCVGPGGIVVGDRHLDWRDMAHRCEALDTALRNDGLGRGAVIGVTGRNDVCSAAAFVGTVASGRCAAVVNGFQPLERIVAAARSSETAALILDEADLGMERVPGKGRIYVTTRDGRVVRHRAGSEVTAARPDCAVILSTSGTTGEPKRIPYLASVMRQALIEITRFNIGFGDLDLPGSEQPPLIQYSPLGHSAGALALARGVREHRTTVIMPKFSPDLWADLIEEHRPRTTGLPPAMMKMLLDAPPVAEKLASLVSVWSGSAPVDPRTVEAFTQRYAIPVLGNYGATEFYGAVASWSLADYHRLRQQKSGAVGRIVKSVAEARIRDLQDGHLLEYGDVGVLELKLHRLGPEWVATTDLARLDADGFLYLQGRADDVIIRGGFKISPDIVAAALKEHPAIADAVVVGIADARLGEVPAAAIELEQAAGDLDEAEIIEFVRSRLPAYFAPVIVRKVDRLPRTLTMKIDRGAVRSLFEFDRAAR